MAIANEINRTIEKHKTERKKNNRKIEQKGKMLQRKNYNSKKKNHTTRGVSSILFAFCYYFFFCFRF